MQIGDLVAYHHDPEQVGMIVGVLEERQMDPILVQWFKVNEAGKRRWCVDPKWIRTVMKAKNEDG